MSVTPSAEVVGLGVVEWLGFRLRLGLGMWLGFGLLRDGQRLWLWVMSPYRLAHHFAHQHIAHLLTWGDAKSPA